MATATIDRPALRLAADDGHPVEREAKAVRTLSDREGEEHILDDLHGICVLLDEGSELRYQVKMLIARFEQRLAQRGVA